MKSNCCNAEIKTISSFEGTSYWECKKCGNGCDPKPNIIFAKIPAKTYRKTAIKETDDVYAAIELLKRLGWVVWRNNTGGMMKTYTTKKGEEKTYRVRFGEPGLPDILGYIPELRRVFRAGCHIKNFAQGSPLLLAQPVYIELKRQGGRVKTEQKAFIDQVRSDGCFAFLGTLDELQKRLESEGYL